MAQVKIIPKDDYPAFRIVGHGDTPQPPIEIPNDKLKWVNKIMADYEESQKYLEDLYNSV